MAKRILLVEDNLTDLDRATQVLQEGGYNVTKVKGISAAEELLQTERKFDCLIIDLNMKNTYLKPEGFTLDSPEAKALRDKTCGGSLTGWVWLYNIAKFILETKHSGIKIMIHSEFIGDLDEEMNKNTTPKEEYDYYNSIPTVLKSKAINGLKILLEEVDILFNVRRK